MQVKDKYFFFNSEDPNEAFWLKNPKILPEPCQILLKQKFHIKTSKEKIKFRTIILTSDYLYRTKVVLLFLLINITFFSG